MSVKTISSTVAGEFIPEGAKRPTVGKDGERTINLTLNVWRQKDRRSEGRFVTYEARDISTDMSFLEMLDVVNEGLITRGEEPIAFDHDCREGICGQCGVVVNGDPHGPRRATTTCQLHMRSFRDGAVLTIEPWRSAAFPVVKDLMVDRSAFDRIIAAGGFISVRTGNAPDGNAILVPKDEADLAMDAAACIGCGACVAACPNASAMLFVGAKVSHLNLLPQGHPERNSRVVAMVDRMDAEGFGSCTNHGECEAACPKEIRLEFISRLNRDYFKAALFSRKKKAGSDSSAG
jgi:succinate dehydrogenase / fumarate reductase iron-sulfur subunit